VQSLASTHADLIHARYALFYTYVRFNLNRVMFIQFCQFPILLLNLMVIIITLIIMIKITICVMICLLCFYTFLFWCFFFKQKS